jgi:hypothetical protein
MPFDVHLLGNSIIQELLNMYQRTYAHWGSAKPRMKRLIEVGPQPTLLLMVHVTPTSLLLDHGGPQFP